MKVPARPGGRFTSSDMRRVITLLERYDASTGEARSNAKRQLAFYGLDAELLAVTLYLEGDDEDH